MPTIMQTVFARLHDDNLTVPTDFATKPLVGPYTGGNGYTGYLQGGIYDKPLRREKPAATPDAFWQSAHGQALRPSAVIRDRGDVQHPQEAWVPGAFDQMVLVYFYAQGVATGKQAIHDAARRARELLDQWRFTTEFGTVAFVKYIDRLGLQDSEEFIGGIFDYCRFRITTRYGNEV